MTFLHRPLIAPSADSAGSPAWAMREEEKVRTALVLADVCTRGPLTGCIPLSMTVFAALSACGGRGGRVVGRQSLQGDSMSSAHPLEGCGARHPARSQR